MCGLLASNNCSINVRLFLVDHYCKLPIALIMFSMYGKRYFGCICLLSQICFVFNLEHFQLILMTLMLDSQVTNWSDDSASKYFGGFYLQLWILPTDLVCTDRASNCMCTHDYSPLPTSHICTFIACIHIMWVHQVEMRP